MKSHFMSIKWINTRRNEYTGDSSNMNILETAAT